MIDSEPNPLRIFDIQTAVRAAADAYGVKSFVIVGKASLAVTLPDSSNELRATMDIDLYPPWNPAMAAKWAAADLHIGRTSQFRSDNGFYVERVAEWTTELLPTDWESRTTALDVDDIHVQAIHPLDLIYAKLRAGRQKDLVFTRKIIDLNISSPTEIGEFIKSHTGSPELIEELNSKLAASINATEEDADELTAQTSQELP